MWASMENNSDIVFTNGNTKGVELVEKSKGGYAFLMESVPMEYNTNKNCVLMKVGELLDSKGMVVHKHSSIRRSFNILSSFSGYGIALSLSKFKT